MTEIQTGSAAVNALPKSLTDTDHFKRWEREHAKRVAGFPQGAPMIFKAKASGPAALVNNLFGAFAQEVYSTDDGWIAVWPYESDSNPDTIEFGAVYHDSYTGYATSIEAQFHSADIENTVNVWWSEAVVACNDRKPEGELAGFFTASLQAQTHYKGISCNDQSKMNQYFYEVEHPAAVKNGAIALGAAAIPCVGTSLGWFACAGGAFAGGYISTIFWSTVSMTWACRCAYLGYC